jgi:hypothetical protein
MACKRSAVRSRLSPPAFRMAAHAVNGSPRSPSSRGLGHHPFTVSTGVRIPLGTPDFVVTQQFGAVVQLVRISACHAEGRGFESRPLRQYFQINPVNSLNCWVFCCIHFERCVLRALSHPRACVPLPSCAVQFLFWRCQSVPEATVHKNLSPFSH